MSSKKEDPPPTAGAETEALPSMAGTGKETSNSSDVPPPPPPPAAVATTAKVSVGGGLKPSLVTADSVGNNLVSKADSSTPSSGTSTPLPPKPKKPLPIKKRSNTTSESSLFIPATEPNKEGENNDRVRLGICAMDKKARSKPMAEILSRLDPTLFQVVFFGDDVILNKPIEEWPCCDVLIAFYSKGYPLAKATEYVKLKQPYSLNDLEMQEKMKDRRAVYDLLEASGIDVPRHMFLSKDGYISTGTGDGGEAMRDQDVKEFDDHIEVNGVSIHKPFVEKPVDADDHNIAIYYPSSAGGGCKKLFRKIGNRSSEFYPDVNEVRRDGSYIYEEFVETQGTDVKMYTVGPEYGHAEARKSPAVDGKVQRNSDGKEVRFPVILSSSEKEIARRIVLEFKQFVCGFDLLRVQERRAVVSYVCDVNGWSFVKNSRKYYDDSAQILTEHVLAAVKPNKLRCFSTLDPLVTDVDNACSESSFFSIKPTVTLSRVARMLHGGPPSSIETEHMSRSASPARSEHSSGFHSVNNAATSLQEGAMPVREIPHNLVSEPASLVPSLSNSIDDLTKLEAGEESSEGGMRRTSSMLSIAQGSHQEELRCVIAVVRHGDRTPKQKLKVNMTEPRILKYFHDHCDSPTKDLKVKDKTPMIEFLQTVKTILHDKQADPDLEELSKDEKKARKKVLNQVQHMRDVLERWKISGLNRKLQIKPRKWTEDSETGMKLCAEVQLILKWGGNLTKLGEHQAIRLGRHIRTRMYPDAPGGGILRLHSTFRHDLKIKTSDEGRVMKTAAAFAKGLLELEGEIPPILVSLVHKEKGSVHMLDPSGDKEVKNELDECKEKITANLQKNCDYRETTEEERVRMVGPVELQSMRDALAEVGNPRESLMEIYKTMGYLIGQLDGMLARMGSGDEKRLEGGEGLQGDNEDDVALSGVKLYKGETLLELTERWKFIHKRLYDADDDLFDLSRIPDVHDNVRFDVLHNPHLGLSSTLEKLYELAKSMADCVVPQEYGSSAVEKRSVGVKICSSLLEKIKYDLCIARTDNKADMRYMINMDYSADLPINTMGRRIRTRLYFTSESHLHTLLNVMRFAQDENSSSLLSPEGVEFISNTRELCYLTQIVIRLFEDTNRPLHDIRRFRVEVLFSPGATATPLHIDEANRDADVSRLDTAELHVIGRDGLTCEEVEAFFGSAILEGGRGEDPELDVTSIGTVEMTRNISDRCAETTKNIIDNDSTLRKSNKTEPKKHARSKSLGLETLYSKPKQEGESASEASKKVQKKGEKATDRTLPVDHRGVNTPKSADDPSQDPMTMNQKYFWGTVAIGTLLLGSGCLVMALSLSGDQRSRRRYTTRR